MIRNLHPHDLEKIREIHDKFFKDEFPLPDFSQMLCPVIIEDDKENIIMAGAIQPFAELVVVADKTKPLIARRKAYNTILHAAVFASARSGYNHLHAFTFDDRWERALRIAGFDDCKGKALYLGVNSNG